MWGILGGGISGLSTGLYLSRTFPDKKFILLNAPYPLSNWGGWIGTLHRQTCLPSFFFETGPRTLRPFGLQGATTLDLIHSLGLDKDLHPIPKTSKAAKNRYLYSNGKLQELPSSIAGALFKTPPIMHGLLKRILQEPFLPSGQSDPEKNSDESIQAFLSRRLGAKTVDDLVSAMMHGIYAGDTKQLSARSTMTTLYKMESEYGSIGKGLLARLLTKKDSDDPLTSIASSPDSLTFIQSIQKESAIYSFKNGMATLVSGLLKELQSRPNVQLLNKGCTAIDFPSTTSLPIQVHSQDNQIFHVERIISTIPARSLTPLLSAKHPTLALHLSSIPDVTVGVVNLLFDSTVKLPVNGFGYLLPRSEASAKILGVIFDSDSLASLTPEDSRVRLTVMMGGSQFQKLFGNPNNVDPNVLLQTALKSLQEHLGLTASPIDSHVVIHKNCIPQYTVGHSKTLQKLSHTLQTDEKLRNRFSLLGASYTGVGINDCILASRRLVDRLGRVPNGAWTGLEDVL